MKFGQSLYFLTYAAAAWSFLMLWLFADINPIASAVYVLAFALCLLNDRRPLPIPERAWLFVSLGALALALYGWFALRMYFDSVVMLFLYLEINKLFTAKSHRDALQIYGLTFFKALAASVSTASVAFAPALLVYVFLIVAAMITITVKRDAELAFQAIRKGKTDPRVKVSAVRMGSKEDTRFVQLLSSEWLTVRLMRRLTLALAFIVSLGMALFFVIPRLQGQAVNIGLTSAGPARMSSGFTDSINFVGMGEIQTDPAIVMRAIPTDGFPLDSGYPVDPLLRLRGTSLDYFDGRTWTKSETVQRRMRTSERRRSWTLPTDMAFKSPERIQSIRVQMEPNARGYVFGSDRPWQYTFDDEQVLVVDEVSGSVQVLRSNWTGPISYVVESRLPASNWGTAEYEAALPIMSADDPPLMNRVLGAFSFRNRREGGPPRPRRFEAFEETYTQLPDNEDMNAVRTVSAEWLEGITDPAEKARRIEHRLRNYFSYSLDVDFSTRPDHLTYFLTEGQAGHCEYFATAMVLMLRANAIPARVVNGYASDEWITGGKGYYLIRQEHAHTWVEAWFPRVGWITFDPTPSSGIGTNRLPNTFYRRFTRWYDMVKFQWYDKIIDYDASDQTGMMVALFKGLNRAGNFGGSLGQSLLGEGGSGGSLLSVGLAVLIGIGGLTGVVMVFRRRRRTRLEIERAGDTLYPKPAPVEEYRLLIEHLEHRLPRPASATPLEYARQVASSDTHFGDFLPLTECYYGVRYNGAVWTQRETDRARALLRLAEQNRDAANRQP